MKLFYFILSFILMTGCHQNVSVNLNRLTYHDILPHLTLLKQGDIIFVEDEYDISSFIPGKWKHVSIYLGNKQSVLSLFNQLNINIEYELQESTHYILDASQIGVKIRKFQLLSNLNKQSCLKSICVLRLNQQYDVNQFIQTCFQHYGKEYDYYYMPNKDKLYCSELIASGLESIINIQPYNIITPTNIYNLLQENNYTKTVFKI